MPHDAGLGSFHFDFLDVTPSSTRPVVFRSIRYANGEEASWAVIVMSGEAFACIRSLRIPDAPKSLHTCIEDVASTPAVAAGRGSQPPRRAHAPRARDVI